MFYGYKNYINDSDYKKHFEAFSDQYWIKDFEMPCDRPEAKKAVSRYIMARYGMFLCYDDLEAWGEHKVMPVVIRRFESEQNVKRCWYMALMYALNEGALTWEDMEPYRKHHKKSKAFLTELKFQYKELRKRIKAEEDEKKRKKEEERRNKRKYA